MKSPVFDPAIAAHRLSDPATATIGFAMVQNAGPSGKALAPRIEEMLKKGLPPALAMQAIQALEAFGPLANPAVVAPYVQHRDPNVRLVAAGALSLQRSAEGAAALRKGLRSNDKDLRAACARGLAGAGDKEAIPDLQKALARGVSEAAPSIAALCSGPSCDALVAQLDKVHPVLAKMSFETLLRRPGPLPDAVLIAAVEKIRPLAGSEGKAYFSALAKRFKGAVKVKRALESAAAHAPKEQAAKKETKR
ncbi:MAG: HEAT repeat domain-containing protein [Polyangiaceae bacterium]